MQRDRLRHPVHRQIAQNIASLRTSLFHASAFECDLRIFLDREKFRTAQMIIALHNSGIDAANVDPGHNRGIFRMLAVDVDLAVEFGKLSVGGAKELVDRKSDRRMRLIEFVGLVRKRGRSQSGSESGSSNNNS